MKRIGIILTVLFSALLFSASCDSDPEGDAATVNVWKEIVEQAKACDNKDCLFDIEVQGKSITKWVMETNVENMTDEELVKYNKYRDEYREIENKLTNN